MWTNASVGMIVCRKWSTTASGAASTASTARRDSENQSEPWKTGSGGAAGSADEDARGEPADLDERVEPRRARHGRDEAGAGVGDAGAWRRGGAAERAPAVRVAAGELVDRAAAQHARRDGRWRMNASYGAASRSASIDATGRTG